MKKKPTKAQYLSKLMKEADMRDGMPVGRMKPIGRFGQFKDIRVL
jgi:hypothetical protein